MRKDRRILAPKRAALFTAIALAISSSAALATNLSTEEKFQSVFTVAGYSTLMGTLLGAAAAGLAGDNPLKEPKYPRLGASLGFILGAGYGGYQIMVTPSYQNYSSGLEAPVYDLVPPKQSDLQISPIFVEGNIEAIAVNWRVPL